MNDYIIYTDGGYRISDNTGSGAYVILKADGQTLLRQEALVFRRENSQRAEIKAIIAAVDALPVHCRAKVYTDNLFAAINLGKVPRRKTKPDVDLLIHYKQLVRQKKVLVEFQWVRSHEGHPWNELCDSLCTEALAAAGQY